MIAHILLIAFVIIIITPKMRETVRGGMPLFSTVGGMVGLGALGSMPSTQDGGT